MRDNKTKFKSKRSQGGVFGLSFGMIFSIILMAIFVVVAFIGIRYFLDFKTCSDVGFFFSELQNKIDVAWHADSYIGYYNATLPSGVQYVCFMDLKSPSKNANTIEESIYEDTLHNEYKSDLNTYLYAPGKNFCVNSKTTKNIDLTAKNPICIPVIKNKISIKIERKFDSPLVFVGS